MKIEKKILPNSLIEFVVEESAENVAKQRGKVFEDLRKNANIKGFRKGAHIPENVLLQHFGEEYITQLAVEHAIDKVYKDVLKKEGIVPVAQAQIQEIISQSPLKIRMQVEVLPEVEIGAGYKKIKLKKQKIEVTDAEVEAALEDIQTRFTHFHEAHDAEVPADMSDRVTIDTDGYDTKGKLLETTSMRAYPLVLGSGLLVPGFEEQIVGMKSGEEKEIDITFPKDYHNADFAGKKTKFKVKVHKIEKSHKPEFTPEFIKELRGKDLDLKGFKALIKEEIKETKQSNALMQEESELIDELLKVSKLEVGPGLLQNQIEKSYADIKENISKDGVNMAHYLESLGMNEEEYKEKNVRPVALKRLQAELIFHKLMEMEGVKVSDAEMGQEVQKIMARFESEDVLKRLAELYVPGNQYFEELRLRATYRKLIDTFFQEKETASPQKSNSKK